jgi:hypothetical protein
MRKLILLKNNQELFMKYLDSYPVYKTSRDNNEEYNLECFKRVANKKY